MKVQCIEEEHCLTDIMESVCQIIDFKNYASCEIWRRQLAFVEDVVGTMLLKLDWTQQLATISSNSPLIQLML